MNMRVVIFCGVMGWGATCGAAGDDFVSPMIATFEAGILCAQDTGIVRDAPDTVSGTTHVIEDAPPFVNTGRVVPAVIGIGFGVRSSLASGFGLDDVTMTVAHPPFASTATTQQSFQSRIGPDGAPSLTFYQFDYGYELALGDWTLSAQLGGITFYETTFTVVPPVALPELAGACGYLDLIG